MLSFTESLMTYALGRRVEYYDMPAIRAIVRDAAKKRLQDVSAFILGVVKSAAFQMSRAAEARAETTERDRRTSPVTEETAMFITQKAHVPPHGPARHGRDDGAAVPRRDGAGAAPRSPRPRAGKVRLSASRWCTARPASTKIGLEKNMWSPAAVGRRFDLDADAA